MKLSNCCNAPIIENTDICSKCKEHCVVEKETWEERFDELCEGRSEFCLQECHHEQDILKQFISQALQEQKEEIIRIMQHQVRNVLKSANAVADWGDLYLENKKDTPSHQVGCEIREEE